MVGRVVLEGAHGGPPAQPRAPTHVPRVQRGPRGKQVTVPAGRANDDSVSAIVAAAVAKR